MAKKTCVLVTSPTGTGKTQLVLKNIARLVDGDFSKVLVVGPNKKATSVWIEELHKWKRLKNKQFTSGTHIDLVEELNSIGESVPQLVSIRKLRNRRSLKGIEVVIFDEWHRISGQTFTKSFLRKLAGVVKASVFVSATPINPVREMQMNDESESSDLSKFNENIDFGTKEAVEKIANYYGSELQHILDFDRPFVDLLKAHISKVAFKSWVTKAAWTTPLEWPEASSQLSEFSFWKSKDRIKYIREASFGREYFYVNHLIATTLKREGFQINESSSQSFTHTYSRKRLHSDDRPRDKNAVRWLNSNSDKCLLIKSLLISIHNKNPQSKVVIFCIHRGTARSLFEYLNSYLPIELRDELIDGSKNIPVRTLKRKFNDEVGGRFLIATDALSESLSLHKRCDYLLHYELPWSPLRLIQRVGRITRILNDKSKTKPAYVAHLIVPGSVEEERVNRLLRRLEILRRRDLLPLPKNSLKFKKFVEGIFGRGPSMLLAQYLSKL